MAKGISAGPRVLNVADAGVAGGTTASSRLNESCVIEAVVGHGMNAVLDTERPNVEFRYAVVLEPEADGSAYNVIVPSLPEAHTWGATVEEALKMAREVIELCIAERRAQGEDIPPSDAHLARLESVHISLPAA